MFPTILFGMPFVTVLYGYLNANPMKFQGDAWKFSFDIGEVITITLGGLFIFCLWWIWKDLKTFKPMTLNVTKKTFIGCAIVIVQSIIILILFAQGNGGVHTNLDRIAVALTVFQGLTIAYFIDGAKIKERTANSI